MSTNPNPIVSRMSLAVLLGACLASAAQAQVFLYRGKIDDSLGGETGRRYKEVQVGDFNKDGWPDLYVAQKQGRQSMDGPNKDRVYINQKTGSLATLTGLFVAQSQPAAFNNLITNRGYDVEVADLDGDGNVDLVRPESGGRVDILWGLGNGQFTPTSIVNLANDPNGGGNYDDVAIGDLDADGDFDILVAQYAATGQNLLLRNRLDTGSARQFNIETLDTANLTHAVSLGDFNKDGMPDIALAKTNGGSRILRANAPACSPTFTLHRTLSPPNSSDPTAVADFVDLDKDGRLDVYIARGVFSDPLVTGERQHYIYFQTSPGTFTRKDPPLGSGDRTVYDARYADVDRDGKVEIIRANIHSTGINSTLQALRVVSQTSVTDVTASFFNNVWRGEMAVELADLDLDGDLDLILGGSSDNTGNLDAGHAAIHIYENRTITTVANKPPIAWPDFAKTPKNTRVSIFLGMVLGNDRDPEGGPLWLDSYDAVTEMGGTTDFGHVGGFNYYPPTGFVGVDRMTYTTIDNAGNRASAILTISVTGCP